jgi:type VI secretion system Hcp family effector
MKPFSFAYMHVKSSSTSMFLGSAAPSGADRSLCLAVRFRGEVPHDVRKGDSHAVTQHEPITVIREWGPSSAQFLTALWSNQVLDEVRFDFVRENDGGKEIVYATLTLGAATVAFVELRSGNTDELMQGEFRALDMIGFRAERIEFKIKDSGGDATANYDRKAQS